MKSLYFLFLPPTRGGGSGGDVSREQTMEKRESEKCVCNHIKHKGSEKENKTSRRESQVEEKNKRICLI